MVPDKSDDDLPGPGSHQIFRHPGPSEHPFAEDVDPSSSARPIRKIHDLKRIHSSNEYSDEDVEEEGRDFGRMHRVATMSKEYTEDEERAVVKKLDRKLVLFLAFLYLLSFLDRSNIGNARIAGLEESLSLTPSQFSLCILGFYVTYIVFEWMILLYRLVPPHIYISSCVLCWGIVASLQSVVTSFKQLLVLRSLLGITEAAFGPGVPFYMTFFYRRSELAYRVGLQISTAPLATSFASSLAWLIVKVSRNGPIEPWRALFLVEGFPSIATAVVAYYFIPDSPETARYLDARERKVAKLRLQSEQSHTETAASTGSSSPLNTREILTTLTDAKAWITALMFFSVNVSFASLPVFLPTIIKAMEFRPLTSQILSAPPYLFAFAFVLLIGHHSDKRADSRSTFLACVALLSSVSYATIAVAGVFEHVLGARLSIAVRYVAVHGAAMGLFAAVILIITWSLNNQQSSTGKGAGLMILNIVGQCGPLIGVMLFPDRQGPHYVQGMVVCAAFMFGVSGLAVGLRFYLVRLNIRLDRVEEKVGGFYQMVQMGVDADADPDTGDDQVDAKVVAQEVEGLMGGGITKKDGRFRYML